MPTMRFRSHELPAPAGEELRRRLAAAHTEEAFSAVDVRATVRRVVAIAQDLGLRSTVIRGGVGLRGWEADHVWLAVDGRVIDAAFPLYDGTFVEVLHRFVADEVPAEDLAAAAAAAGVDERVLGCFPSPVGYVGAPVWQDRAVSR